MKIELEGKIVTVQEGALDACIQIRDNAAAELKKLMESGWDKEKSQARITDFLRRSVDELLGEDAAAEALGENEPSVTCLCSLLCHIAAEVGRQLGEGSENGDA